MLNCLEIQWVALKRTVFISSLNSGNLVSSKLTLLTINGCYHEPSQQCDVEDALSSLRHRREHETPMLPAAK